MIYRCGCCLISGTAKYPVAWCCGHDFYECRTCWEHGHPWATEDTWGCCEGTEGCQECYKGTKENWRADEDEGGSDTS